MTERGVRDVREPLESRRVGLADVERTLAPGEARAADVEVRGEEEHVTRGVVAGGEAALEGLLDALDPLRVGGRPRRRVLEAVDHPVRVHERQERDPDDLAVGAGQVEHAALLRRPHAVDEADARVGPLEPVEEAEERGRVVVAGEHDHGSDRRELLQRLDGEGHLGVAGPEPVEDVAGVEDEVRPHLAGELDDLPERGLVVGHAGRAVRLAPDVPVGDVEEPHGLLVTRTRERRSEAPVPVVRLDLEVDVPPFRRSLEQRGVRGRRHVEVDVRTAAPELDVQLARVPVVPDELDARRVDGDHLGGPHAAISADATAASSSRPSSTDRRSPGWLPATGSS